jgi:hypothetical protein
MKMDHWNMDNTKQIPDWIHDLLSEEDVFWKDQYLNFSFDKKVEFWSEQLHHTMRWQIESGLDPYSVYDAEWYRDLKNLEPNIDLIMNTIFDKYWNSAGCGWSKEVFLKRIQ